jgi:hypothetical protein
MRAQLIFLAALAGCSSKGTCVNGQSISCACNDGRSGAQVCQSGAYSACACTGAATPDLAGVVVDLAGGSNDGGVGKRLFITASEYDGDLKTAGGASDGLTGADHLCATAAAAALLGGTWKAWLSGNGVNAIDRLNDVGPWSLTTGERVFNNKANLQTVPLVPIVRDENGKMVTTTQVWTGTDDGGHEHVGKSCNAFASNAPGMSGVVGDAMTPSSWTATTLDACSVGHHLYCFEQ